MDIDQRMTNLAKSGLNDLGSLADILTFEKIYEIINLPANRDYFLNEVELCGYEEESEYGLDTCVREELMDAVSKYYLSCSWPTYSDNVNLDEFLQELEDAIQREMKND
jgi:hypothetical protein